MWFLRHEFDFRNNAIYFFSRIEYYECRQGFYSQQNKKYNNARRRKRDESTYRNW